MVLGRRGCRLCGHYVDVVPGLKSFPSAIVFSGRSFLDRLQQHVLPMKRGNIVQIT